MSVWEKVQKIVEDAAGREQSSDVGRPIRVFLTKKDVTQLQIAVQKTVAGSDHPEITQKWAKAMLKKLKDAAGPSAGRG